VIHLAAATALNLCIGHAPGALHAWGHLDVRYRRMLGPDDLGRSPAVSVLVHVRGYESALLYVLLYDSGRVEPGLPSGEDRNDLAGSAIVMVSRGSSAIPSA
jgi:hypothetical protein